MAVLIGEHPKNGELKEKKGREERVGSVSFSTRRVERKRAGFVAHAILGSSRLHGVVGSIVGISDLKIRTKLSQVRERGKSSREERRSELTKSYPFVTLQPAPLQKINATR